MICAITFYILNPIAQNHVEGEKSKDFNLHDHPIIHHHIPLPENKDKDDMGKLLPIDIARNFDRDK